MKKYLYLFVLCCFSLTSSAQILTMDYDGNFIVNQYDVLALLEHRNQTEFTATQAFRLAQEWQQQGNQRINPYSGLLEVRLTLLDNDVNIIYLDLVRINAGTYRMGSPSTEHQRFGAPSLAQIEWVPHEVTISQDFYIGKYEITQAQWIALMGENPSEYENRPNNPIDQVSWHDSQNFITQLNQQGLGTFRLPTEAEWEYACRAGTETPYNHPFSNCLIPNFRCIEYSNFMWYSENTSGSVSVGHRQVGLKQPNPWGLYDMHGNVYEWCQDYWQAPFNRGPVTDPGILEPNGQGNIIRGGSWISPPTNCRSANRNLETPTFRANNIGFRIVATEIVE